MKGLASGASGAVGEQDTAEGRPLVRGHIVFIVVPL